MTSFYDDFYTKAEQSKAHKAFCEKVYGKDLCQHGMADMVQIELMLRMLDLRGNSRLLDLGCGNGYITEYIQSATGCFALGVDLSCAAIESAVNRTKTKAGKLTFQVADMTDLPFGANTFDAIILIDTHYFVDDFEALIERLRELTVPGGKICVFSDEGRGVNGLDDSALQADESLIGQLLDRKNFTYTAVNLTKENREHWRLKESILKELKSEFEAEGNISLYNSRMGECTQLDRTLDCRFLFCITK
jgi:SAM-dependent methyltransferase